MKHDPTSAQDEMRLAALYQVHIASAEQPSAAANARILALAREAVAHDAPARAAATTAAAGWRSWLGSSWFGPGLAFATIASLSVVVVSLMPKEDMSVERAVMQAPSGAADAEKVAPVPSPAAPAPTAAATSAASEVSVQQAPVGQSKAKLAQLAEPARAAPAPGAPAATRPAAPATGAAPAVSAAAPNDAISANVAPAIAPGMALRQRAESAPAQRGDLPNPFPAQAPSMNDMAAKKPAASIIAAPAGPVAAGAAAPVSAPPAAAPPAPSLAVAPPSATTLALRSAPAASAEAGAAPRLEKPSLQSAPVESRLLSSQSIPEVRDSAPTYPNEAQSSIPLPYTYATPRASARDAAAPTMAAAAPRRDPVEWIKAIQKLRVEGKSEQVLKELIEFRRQHPQYPLPNELKQLK